MQEEPGRLQPCRPGPAEQASLAGLSSVALSRAAAPTLPSLAPRVGAVARTTIAVTAVVGVSVAVAVTIVAGVGGGIGIWIAVSGTIAQRAAVRAPAQAQHSVGRVGRRGAAVSGWTRFLCRHIEF